MTDIAKPDPEFAVSFSSFNDAVRWMSDNPSLGDDECRRIRQSLDDADRRWNQTSE